MEYTKALADLIEEFNKFPGVGPKSAQRMAFSVLKKSTEQNQKFIEIVRRAKNEIKQCEICFNLCSDTICEICQDSRRNKSIICIVEEVKDLIAIEKTKEFRGTYHVLGGLISPLDGISSADLNIEPLLERIKGHFDNDPRGLAGTDIQGLRSSKNLSLPGVNDDFESKYNAEDSQPNNDSRGLAGADIQGLRSSKNLSLPGVNDDFESKHNAEDSQPNNDSRGLAGADIQGLRSSKNLSLPGVNDDFESKHNAEDRFLQDPLELVFAISPSTEGEATILYLKKVIKRLELDDNIQMSRLAYGLPLGADLDYADELTIVKALEARVKL